MPAVQVGTFGQKREISDLCNFFNRNIIALQCHVSSAVQEVNQLCACAYVPHTLDLRPDKS